jgi:hypothetical protein
MCLRTDVKLTKRAFAREQQIVKRYKVVKIEKGKLCSPMYKKQWRAGVNRSNIGKIPLKEKILESMGFLQKWSQLRKGIHVFQTLKGAKEFVTRNIDSYEELVTITLMCDVKDLVGVGRKKNANHEVYTKVTFEKKDYERAMKFIRIVRAAKAADAA